MAKTASLNCAAVARAANTDEVNDVRRDAREALTVLHP